MFKKYLTLILAVLVLNLSLSATAFAGTKEDKIAKSAEKVKANIAKIGIGKDARVEVKLRDDTKLKGYISRINENSFVVVEDKTENISEVPFSNAKQIKGNNLSTGVKIVIGVGVVIAIIAIIAFVGNSID
jgi:small nuclear ribonucleoprotein (snRNP)-like protein